MPGSTLAHSADRAASCATAIRRETIVNFPVQPLTMVLLDLGEFQQELAFGFREDFHRSPQVPNDHAVLLGRCLVVPYQFGQFERYGRELTHPDILHAIIDNSPRCSIDGQMLAVILAALR